MSSETETEPKTHNVRLIRGRSYIYGKFHFLKGVDTPVPERIKEVLENEVLTRTDSDGEVIEKKRFKITSLDEDEDGGPKIARRAGKKRPSRTTSR